MQRICWAGWPARETELLGDWALRAHAGITGRANSAMAVGDPGRPVAEALDAVARLVRRSAGCRRCCSCRWPTRPTGRWPTPGGTACTSRWCRWRRSPRCSRPLPRADLRAVVEPTPSADWLVADARPRRGRRHPRRDPDRPGGRRLRHALPRRPAARHRPGLGRGRVGRGHVGRRRPVGPPARASGQQ